jgi:hypothetical protein
MKNKSLINPEIFLDVEEQSKERRYEELYKRIGNLAYQSCEKVNLYNEVRRNAETELMVIKKLCEIRQEIKLLIKKK